MIYLWLYLGTCAIHFRHKLPITIKNEISVSKIALDLKFEIIECALLVFGFTTVYNKFCIL